jgi:hypothetical protein
VLNSIVIFITYIIKVEKHHVRWNVIVEAFHRAIILRHVTSLSILRKCGARGQTHAELVASSVCIRGEIPPLTSNWELTVELHLFKIECVVYCVSQRCGWIPVTLVTRSRDLVCLLDLLRRYWHG